MRRPVIAGNWKMYKTICEAVDFIRELRPVVANVNHCGIVVAPPFTSLRAVADAVRGSNIQVAAQNVHWERDGAYTGEISAPMLADAGCTHVIIGHSERRQNCGETDDTVNRKLKASIAAGLTPIVCVGETLTEREQGHTNSVLSRQFTGGLAGLTPQEFSRIIIAYEPVWAIGTGRTATPEIAEESHAFIRHVAALQFGELAAGEVRVLYGGSVKPDNIGGLMTQADIDGALVGGASLNVNSFLAIINFQ